MKITLNIECNNLDEMLYIQEALVQQRSIPVQTVATERVNDVTTTTEFTQLTDEQKKTWVAPVKERPNVSPGTPTVSKMGADRKQAIFAGVRAGDFVNGYSGVSLPYLQLLWSRGEVRFDGQDFYI